jgi:hypothetical protein
MRSLSQAPASVMSPLIIPPHECIHSMTKNVMPMNCSPSLDHELATRHRCSVRHVNMTISLAFLAPALVKAAVEGRLPRGIGVARLRDVPAEWPRQFERLGLASPK